ncbi:NrtA/SsuA/CpmA family ABC transporter substrate-binding protein [Nocardia asteroides]|uniref:Aliphatic sulfonates ABC transporter substrate-binding protein n=1 Tax=Nocardia asteroides NBRC 15531 TaxID=1110697 RepID=U5E8W5_NOCAS|nr:NrtA/SsuA/CpmA family ABC transporter substrate-binding protein [Nocardia asteroides]TLF66969.1 ABC transporter substrate-binding protein [Nocardia asteroides NBRC 15531]UGT51775.1 NrtA/SsuA/CpmA family ABC transporter substrate-binding protein [Nocardia asteroides]SFM17205.1 sulfonate transport system substrate-binding protein [Nocardia asteroides]VEG35315.1 Putative aliphatic sulfonates-binding protein precursor [Nocardia asteroides]GAD86527.1 aliphatic sulfonates ABC transporter substrat
MSRRLPAFTRIVLAIAPVVALVAACGSGSTPENSAEASFVLKVTDPGNTGPLAVGKRDGTFDAALAPLGAKIQWVNTTPGFSSNLKLFNTKELDVSGAAFSPVVGALSKDVGVKIVAVADPAGQDQSGIIVSPESGVTSVAGLVGKRIAVNPAGKGEYITLKALAQAGIPADKVTRVPLQQKDAASAFATGKVDAWASFLVPYQEAKAAGGREIATEKSIGSNDNTVVVFRTEVLEQRPDVAAKYLEVLQGLTAKQKAAPAEFENVFEKTGPRALTGDRLADAVRVGSEVTVPRLPAESDAADLADVVNTFADNGVITRRITAADIFYDLRSKLTPEQLAALKEN